MSTAPVRHEEAQGAFDHGARSRFNAWFFAAFERYINHIGRFHKGLAFGDLAAGTVLEIGAGVGANVSYLAPGTELLALEPNLAMHDRLRARCARAGVPVTVIAGGAERIPLPDASVDEVICSLVLCTVAEPEQVLAEVRRVLRPGGRFRFVEHVAAPRRGPRRMVQRLIRRPWSWLFEGCRLDRHTVDVIARAGFSDMTVAHRRFRRSVFYPVNSAVWGIARV
jgi:ubiquinone/menaquinone biosynthesis C-methylase UbiE